MAVAVQLANDRRKIPRARILLRLLRACWRAPGTRKPDRRAHRLQSGAGSADGDRLGLPGCCRALWQTNGSPRLFGAARGSGSQWRVEDIHRKLPPDGDWTDRVAGIAWELIAARRRSGRHQSSDRFAGACRRQVELVGGAGGFARARSGWSAGSSGTRATGALGGDGFRRRAVRHHETSSFFGGRDRRARRVLLDCRSLAWRTVKKLPGDVAIVTALIR